MSHWCGTCAASYARYGDGPFSPSPEQEQAYLDSRQPTPWYAQPGWYANVIGQQLQPPAPQQPIYVVEEPVSPWVWILGGAAVVVVIRALR